MDGAGITGSKSVAADGFHRRTAIRWKSAMFAESIVAFTVRPIAPPEVITRFGEKANWASNLDAMPDVIPGHPLASPLIVDNKSAVSPGAEPSLWACPEGEGA